MKKLTLLSTLVSTFFLSTVVPVMAQTRRQYADPDAQRAYDQGYAFGQVAIPFIMICCCLLVVIIIGIVIFVLVRKKGSKAETPVEPKATKTKATPVKE